MEAAVSLPAYQGPFGPEQAERLAWRAGFGPRAGEPVALARVGLDAAVIGLTRPQSRELVGPPPHVEHRRPLAPASAWGHDHLWWLDRMVRSRAQLVERMTLIWHDWFATSNQGVGDQRLMLDQNRLFRGHALGSFADLLLGVTRDPAMLLWLNGADNSRQAPNENYAREMMELFTLGADRGAYTEEDVRQQARALTGWRYRWARGRGAFDFHFDPAAHDGGVKTIFSQRGRFDWTDSCRLCLEHPLHASFFVRKLWSYFVPTPPDPATERALEALYRGSDYGIRPVVDAILRHPLLYTGPRLVKPPVVLQAGLLRALDRGVDTSDWAWLGAAAGQQLFYPPNVAGWDDTRWLDTATFRGRWENVATAVRPIQLDPDKARSKPPVSAEILLQRALASWRSPTIGETTRRALLRFATRALADAHADWQRQAYTALTTNALRLLIAVSPDFQTA